MSCGFAVIAIVLATSAQAQAPPADEPPIVLTIHPAAAPVPALKYKLVPDRRDQVPGNAAVFYHRAIEMLLGHRQAAQQQPPGADDAAKPPTENAVSTWLSGSLDQLPRGPAHCLLVTYANVFHEVDLGAQRTFCDWEFDSRTESYNLLLPEIQEMRSLARLVAVRVRLAVAEGRTDEALHWLAVGHTMARHTSQGPSLIQSLVGVAICSVMNRCMDDLVQAPGTPSLYWMLANRPRPFIDFDVAYQAERYGLELALPTLRELDRAPWSLAQARRFTDDLQAKLQEFASVGDLPALPERLGLAVMVARSYPEAKAALLAQGRPAAEVEAMPTIQVVALVTMQMFAAQRDEMYKWLGIPYWQAYQGIKRTSQQFSACIQGPNSLLALFSLVMPAFNSARLAEVRNERQLDVLQCIEAIRLYAATHEGRLPENLGVLSDSPAPLDPATGRPFAYRRDDGGGATATLSAPAPPGAPDVPSYRLNYVLKLAR